MLTIALLVLAQTAIAPLEVGEPPPALADLPNVTVSYYSVLGTDPRAIRRSMNERRPRDPLTSEAYDGRTEVSYRWSAPGRSKGGCDTSKARFEHKVAVILPRLEEGARLSSTERAEWDGYMSRLIAHERNHALIGIRSGDEVEKRVRSAADCSAAQAAAETIAAATRAAHVEYDARTKHGLLEGAVYPSGSAAAPRRGRNR